MSALTSKTSMIIDGIAASEAIDSSGEILDVDGCDISDFEKGVGVINYEHKGDSDPAVDVVGKIIYAKKIFVKDDCDDKRQEAYWDHVKLPFVYIKARLYDGSDHAGAKALAASIRDAVTHNEPLLARFSIEGSTLKKEGNRLAATIARKVALTFKPANKSAITGMISDPHGAKPITEKQADKSLFDQLLDTKKNERSLRPGEQHLGSYEMSYDSLMVTEDPAEMMKSAALQLKRMIKAMEGGQGGGAPSTLTGGAALQREDFRLNHENNKNRLRAAVRDYDPVQHGYGKNAMLKFFKFRLPDVNDQFIDHFTDLIDDVRTRQVGDWYKKAQEVWNAVQKAETRFEAMDKAEKEAKVKKPINPEPPTKEPLPVESFQPAPKLDKPESLGTRKGAPSVTQGQLIQPKTAQTSSLYDYGSDKQFLDILNADDPTSSPDLAPEHRAFVLKNVHEPWTRAMRSWLTLNKMAQQGSLPPSVIAHAAIFSAMSPNTPVPLQELYYAHYLDFASQPGMSDLFLRPTDPKDAAAFHRYLNKIDPPNFMREYFMRPEAGVSFGADRNSKNNPEAILGDRPQGKPLLNYHKFHPFISALVNKFGADGHALTSYYEQNRKQDPNFMHGYGQKLLRYFGLMMGQGNMIVPDRHMVRHLFNIPLSDTANHARLTSVLLGNPRLLNAIDHHFQDNAPGVDYVLHKFGDHFQGNREQAVGPAFWLQWLAFPHYEQLKGLPTENLNVGTAHDPYFVMTNRLLSDLSIPHEQHDLGFLGKSQKDNNLSLPHRVALATKAIENRFGEVPAMLFYHTYGVPALLANDRMNKLDDNSMMKMEYAAIEAARLTKAAGSLPNINTLTSIPAPATEQVPPMPQVQFQSKKVQPGFATIFNKLNGEHVPEGRHMAILGRVAAGHGDEYVMVPHEKVGNHAPEDMERWPINLPNIIHAEPVSNEIQPGVVDADIHAPKEFLRHGHSRDLIHGMDMTENADRPEHFKKGVNQSFWRKNAKNKMVLIKNHDARIHGFFPSGAHAEALYHNMLHEMGLGKFIMPTAVFKDPVSDDWVSGMEAIPNASHHNGNKKQVDLLKALNDNGDLHKLGIMNSFAQNSDRHANNFMYGNDDQDLYMIDHGYTFNDSALRFPYYMNDHRDSKLHPEARKWLEDLNPEKLGKILDEHKVPVPLKNSAMHRLQDMKDYAQQEPGASVSEVMTYPDWMGTASPYHHEDAIERRPNQDSGLKLRHSQRKLQREIVRADRQKERDPRGWARNKALAEYLKQHRNHGHDIDPTELLANVAHGGDKEANAKFMRTFHGAGIAVDDNTIARNFNEEVRNTAHGRIAQAKEWADWQARESVNWLGHSTPEAMIRQMKDAAGGNLDLLAEKLHLPDRKEGQDDDSFMADLQAKVEHHFHKYKQALDIANKQIAQKPEARV